MTDPYEDQITDEACLDMRSASGRVNDDRVLVGFLYGLGRDKLPLGTIEDLIHGEEMVECYYTNGWLAEWAQYTADRLTGKRGPRGTVGPLPEEPAEDLLDMNLEVFTHVKRQEVVSMLERFHNWADRDEMPPYQLMMDLGQFLELFDLAVRQNGEVVKW